MVVVAQLVRASVCGTEGRRFEPGLPPRKILRNQDLFFCLKLSSGDPRGVPRTFRTCRSSSRLQKLRFLWFEPGLPPRKILRNQDLFFCLKLSSGDPRGVPRTFRTCRSSSRLQKLRFFFRLFRTPVRASVFKNCVFSFCYCYEFLTLINS